MNDAGQLSVLLERLVASIAHISLLLADCVRQLQEAGELSPEDAERLLETLCVPKAADVQDSGPTAGDSALMNAGVDRSSSHRGRSRRRDHSASGASDEGGRVDPAS